jgi:hypothetical protein
VYKIADPGTVNLMRAGMTLITALVMLFTLGTKISKIQWAAISTQASLTPTPLKNQRLTWSN